MAKAAAKNRVKVEANDAGFSVHFSGPTMARVNKKLLQDCFTALVACAETNACFEKGFTTACLGTIAAHDRRTQCCAQAFGLKAAVR